MNPVFMLDEIDKIGVGFQGDPAAALLEVLDPAQNHSFRDHYLEIPVDLSRVLFIATANQLGTIHPALLDRMEIISLAGYTEEEKLHIARALPGAAPARASTASAPSALDDRRRGAAARHREYTREAGVRSLERQIGAIARKVAARVARPRPTAGRRRRRSIADEICPTTSGPPRFQREVAFRVSRPGVATGRRLDRNRRRRAVHRGDACCPAATRTSSSPASSAT